jgi:hypothetical protein
LSRLLLIFLFSFSFTARAALFSDFLELPTDDKKWPVRIAQFDFESFLHKQETDIANMFGHHTVANFNNDKHTRYKFYVEILEIFDLTYTYNKMKVSYEQNASFTLQENDFHFRDQSYGIGFNIFNVRVEVGMGNYSSFTFLETDTTTYYFIPLKDDYFYGMLEVKVPTRLWVDLTLRFTAKTYKSSDNEVYKLEKASSREWYASVTGGLRWFKAGPYVAYGYETSKFKHQFFGLDNEMANKQHYQKYGVVFQFYP